MRITIVLDSLHLGGSEILAVRLARKFCMQGHTLFFIALQDEGEISKKITAMGAEYYTIGAPDGVRIKTMIKMALLLRRVRPDIVLTNHFRPLLHTWLATVIQRIDLYHVEHDSLHYRNKNKYLKILRFLLPGIKKMVVISPTLQSYFTNKIPACKEKFVLIANGIDTEHFTPAIPSGQKDNNLRISKDSKDPVFGTCARLVPIKNIDLMLDIFRAYRQTYRCGRLILVGDGVCRTSLEQKVSEYGLEDVVTFAGYQNDCAPWYRQMDIYLLTSDDEGLPLSVLEAMASGVVVVSRDVGDMRRLLEQCGGIIVPGTDPDKWLQALQELTADKNSFRQLADSVCEAARKYYSLDNCADQYLHLFQQGKEPLPPLES